MLLRIDGRYRTRTSNESRRKKNNSRYSAAQALHDERQRDLAIDRGEEPPHLSAIEAGPYGSTWDRMATAWAKLDDIQRSRLIKLAEQFSGTSPRIKRTTLPAVNEDERLINQKTAAAMIGVHVSTLHAWEKRGKLKGREVIGRTVHYTIAALNDACGDKYQLELGALASPHVAREVGQGSPLSPSTGGDAGGSTRSKNLSPHPQALISSAEDASEANEMDESPLARTQNLTKAKENDPSSGDGDREDLAGQASPHTAAGGRTV